MPLSNLAPKKKTTKAIDKAAEELHTGKKQKKSVKFNINLTPDFYKKLKAFSDRTGLDMTAILTIGGGQFMNNYEG